MKLKKLLPSLLLTGSIWLIVTTPAHGEEQDSGTPNARGLGSEMRLKLLTSVQVSHERTRIRQLNEFEQPSKSANLLVQSQTPSSSEIVQVTDVKIQQVNQGLEVILLTSKSDRIEVSPIQDGKTFTADINSAQLNLPNSNTIRQEKPIPGVAEVTIVNLNANTIRMTVVGEASIPKVELFDGDEGLVFSVTSDASITQQQPPQKPEVKPDTPAQNQPEQPASSETEEPIELVVTGTQDGYRVPEASTATKTDTPIRDIPASIQVVPQQVLQDQKVTRIQDALRNVSGVTQARNYAGTDAGVQNIRGFTQDFNFKDGFRSDDNFTISETANLEQIEVLKGPASVLFGQAQPGGIVNLVTKKPLSEPYYGFGVDIGSYNFYRPTLDISGPLTTDKNLLYRFNLGYQNSGSFRDFQNTERIFVAPIVTWNIDKNTNLSANFEYLNNQSGFDRGVPALSNGSFADIPINRFLGYPQANDYNINSYKGGYVFEHRFNEDWKIRNALSILSYEEDLFGTDFGAGLVDDQFISRSITRQRNVRENYGLQTELTGKLKTGAIAHNLLFGVELNRRTLNFNIREAEAPLLDIFNPVYDVELPTELTPSYVTLIRTDTLGIYLQDQINLLDNLKLVVGARFDSTNQQTDDFLTESTTSQSDTAFSPRVGLVYQPSKEISLYASYSNSFLPVIGRSANNSPFEPERGTQYEVGVKGDLFDGRLSATLSAYQLTKTNILTSDPNNADEFIQLGEARSRGIEFDLAGEILPGWKIIASYAYTDAKVTEDKNPLLVDSRLQGIPYNTASLWTTYEFQNGGLKGFGFGAGLFYVGDKPGFADFDPPGFKLPSYVRTDAAIFYRRDNWKASINIQNLFDTKYYETSQGVDINYFGAPLTVIGSLSVQF
jgi:iron complex outermembrane recepter protein